MAKTRFWKMYAPDNPQLATALYVTHAFEAPLKAALLVLALFGLLFRNPSARTALFVSMSLVPPINIAFHFRAQGFPLSDGPEHHPLGVVPAHQGARAACGTKRDDRAEGGVPVWQIASQPGWNCSTFPVLIPFVPLLFWWVVYAAVGRTREDL